MEPIKIALVAIGGYGETNLNGVLSYPQQERIRIVGAIDPYADKAASADRLRELNVPFYNNLEEFYADNTADLVVVSSPISLHCAQTCCALEHGSCVLCEKPLGATLQEAQQMIAAREKAGKWVGIGYQWSFTDAIQALKQDVMSGRLGAPKRLSTAVFWPRNHKYYHRNNWAGALRNGQGHWVLDSPINNAVSHYLHNMFFIMDLQLGQANSLVDVQAELYRANDISNFDAAALRTHTTDNTEVLFYAVHSCLHANGPCGIYEFENATVTFGAPDADFVATFKDGATKAYGTPQTQYHKKIHDAIDAVRRDGIACTIEQAAVQTLCINGAQDSMPEITRFPASMIKTTRDPHVDEEDIELTYADGAAEVFRQCYEKHVLPSELGASWACPGDVIDLRNYQSFPQRVK